MDKTRHALKYRFMQQETGTHKLYLYDEVRALGPFNWDTWEFEESETSAKAFRDKLDEIPDGEAIELHVNSAGGEVGEGVTIYNLLKQKAKAGCRIVGYVDGTAYSVAMDIVMACDEIHMGLGTTMFLHYPWIAGVAGNAAQLRNYADQLDALGDASVQLYMARAHDLEEMKLREMMEKETMLSPDICLKYGFCDFVDEYNAMNPETEEVRQLKEQVKQLMVKTTEQEALIKAMQEAKKTDQKPLLKDTLALAAGIFSNKNNY